MVKLKKNKVIKSLSLIAVSSVLAGSILSATAYADALPTYVNSVENGYVTDVKSQGKWGVCWAFADTAAAEVSINKEHNTKVDLSEMLHIYATGHPTLYGTIANDRVETNYETNTSFLHGGNAYTSAINAMNWLGPFPENENYPYNSWGTPSIADKEFTEEEWNAILDSAVARMTDFYVVGAEEADYINKAKELVYKFGSARIGYNHTSAPENLESFMNVIDGEYYYYCPFGYSTNHGVAIVGYDDSIPAENFINNGYQPAGDGGWLIKNSWGDDDHKDGYFWMSYYDTTIGSVYAFDYATVNDKDYYDNLHTYDGTTANISYGYGKPVIYSANVFTAEKGEIIKAASFYTISTFETNYEVSLYLNPEAGNPSSGTLAATTTLTTDYEGYHTVEFPTATAVNKGDTFSVVLKASTEVEEKTLVAHFENSKPSTNEEYQPVVGYNEGESYISSNGTYWKDATLLSTPGNARIKAYSFDRTVLSKPEITVTPLVDAGINIAWDTVEGATSYEVYIDYGSGFKLISTKKENVTNCWLINLNKSSYKFMVRAVADDGLTTMDSDIADVKYALTLSTPTMMASADDTDAVITWNSNKYANGYIIQQYIDGVWTNVVNIKDNTVTEYRMTSLKPGVAHKFRMCSYNNTRESYTVYSKFTAATSVTITSVQMSELKVTTRNADTVTLGWERNENATGYVIQQYKNNSWVNVTNIKDNKVVSYKVSGLAANTSYKFRAVAYMTLNGTTTYGKYTSALTISTAPAMTTGFAITGRGSDYLTITWTKNAGASGYIIQEQVDGVWKNVASIKGNATTSYTVANLQPNSFHRYRMVAYKTDANGTCYGKYTGSAPGYTAPAMVSGFKVSNIGADSLTVSWDKVTSANGYVIDIYRDGKWSQLAKITSSATTSYKASGLTTGTTYKFRIKSYATNGTLTIYSTYSSAISGVPAISAPTNLTMTNRGTDFISVRWDKNADADGYMVYIYDGTKWTCVKTLTTASSVSHKITGLESGKAYKVTVKAFKTVNGAKFISDATTISANTL